MCPAHCYNVQQENLDGVKWAVAYKFWLVNEITQAKYVKQKFSVNQPASDIDAMK